MKLRRLFTAPVRRLLRAAGYDVVRVEPGPAAPAPPPDLPEPAASNAILRRIYQEGAIEDADGNVLTDALMSAIQMADGLLLYNLVRNTRPAATLEIGMAYASSTLFICEAHRVNGGGRHVAMDPFQEASFHDIGLLNVERAGFGDMVTFYPEESYKVLPRLLAEGQQFDFVFIDGDHLFDSALLDFYYADKLLPPGGMVMFHDMDMPSIRKAVSFVLRNKPYSVIEDFHGTPPPPFKRRCIEFLKNVKNNPFEPLIWPHHSIRTPFLSIVLRKTGNDTRLWTHYASF